MTALTRLRIAGFKSFAEPVSIELLPGLTGIVGPNGCGKSNVVEALRWAMGESSARSLRGGDMDDVIFAGSGGRASRNLAEVSITLEPDEDGALPEPFAADSALQVTRRIERGAGSAYRAQGREMRARDVQTLFADLASGARSSGIVSQGRVATLVSAKPEERRQVLEEAAGIGGLHARRHEAELKLRAAEANLARAEERRGQLEIEAAATRRQAKQASRYRAISDLIRTAEAEHLAVLHARAAAAAERSASAAAAAAETEREQAEGREAAEAASVAAEAALAAPRVAEAASRTELERRRMAVEQVARDIAQAEEALAEARARLGALEQDCAAAAAAEAEAGASCDRIGGEREQLAARLEALPEEIGFAEHVEQQARHVAAEAEAASEAAAALASEAAAAKRQAEAEANGAAARHREAAARLAEAEAALEAAQAALVPQAERDAAACRLAECTNARAQAEAEAEAAERREAEAARHHESALQRAARAAEAAETARSRRDEARLRTAELAARFDESRTGLAAAQAQRIPEAALERAEAELASAGAALAGSEDLLEVLGQGSLETGRLLLAAERDAADAAQSRARLLPLREAAVTRARRLAREHVESEARLAEAAASLVPAERLGEAETSLKAAESLAREREAAVADCSAAQLEAAGAAARSRRDVEQAEVEATRLAAERTGLFAALGPALTSSTTALAEAPVELEAALEAALADEPDLSSDPTGAVCWRTLPTLPDESPPPGCTWLAELFAPPAHLARKLSRVALLGPEADPEALLPNLAPGVIAVSREGASWRWDGRVRRGGAGAAGTSRLAQLRRLRHLEMDDEAAGAALLAVRAAAMRESDAQREAEQRLERARETLAQTAAALARAQAAVNALQAEAERAASNHAARLGDTSRLAAEQVEAADRLNDVEAALATLPAESALETALANARGALRERETALAEARLARDAARDAMEAARRAAAELRLRHDGAEARCASLEPEVARLARDLEPAEAVLAAAAIQVARLPDPAQIACDCEAAAEVALAAAEAARVASWQREPARDAENFCRDELARLDAAHAAALARHGAAEAWVARAAAEHAAGAAELGTAQQTLAAMPDPERLAGVAREVRERVAEARARHAAGAAALGAREHERQEATRRLRAIATEQESWTRAHAEAGSRLATLESRAAQQRKALAIFAAQPAGLRERAREIEARLADQEAGFAAASAALHQAERAARDAAQHLRESEAVLGGGREARIRAEAGAEAAAAALATVRARIAEQLGKDANLPGMAEASNDAEDRARRKHERLLREREQMGPVNLRADLELQETETEIGRIEQERDELTIAIAKLRGAIGHLNREGRERLSAVFAEVDRHFRALFTRMMGGGRAHLALTGSDDPLEAGLEIYAEPPGKKLATLSLLSGGEQALTALSLIFAVFRCQPAPIAVLDEVDAPLDDANVGRFCALLEDVSRETGTRFLVVTHHQLTMSRMDRLFGVTMQERGVSRLLSVDLSRATELAQPVLQAAE